MEHRLHQRLSASLAVDIFRSGKHLGEFIVKDVSSGGFAVFDLEHQLSLYDFLEARVKSNSGGTVMPRRLRALVVRTDGNIAGTMIAPGSARSMEDAA